MKNLWRCAVPTTLLREVFGAKYPLILVTPDMRTAQELVARAKSIETHAAVVVRDTPTIPEYGVLSGFATNEARDAMIAWLGSDDPRAIEWRQLGFRLLGDVEFTDGPELPA